MTREEKQKVIDALKISVPIKALTQEEFEDYIQTLNKIMDWLEQEPKTGHWIGRDVSSTNFYGKCSKCGLEFQVDAWYTQNMNYCPNCGCRMIEPQESEDKE